MGVVFQTLATCAHRHCWPIHGSNIPIAGGFPFQVGEVMDMAKSITATRTVVALGHIFAANGLPEQFVSDNSP